MNGVSKYPVHMDYTTRQVLPRIGECVEEMRRVSLEPFLDERSSPILSGGRAADVDPDLSDHSSPRRPQSSPRDLAELNRMQTTETCVKPKFAHLYEEQMEMDLDTSRSKAHYEGMLSDYFRVRDPEQEHHPEEEWQEPSYYAGSPQKRAQTKRSPPRRQPQATTPTHYSDHPSRTSPQPFFEEYYEPNVVRYNPESPRSVSPRSRPLEVNTNTDHPLDKLMRSPRTTEGGVGAGTKTRYEELYSEQFGMEATIPTGRTKMSRPPPRREPEAAPAAPAPTSPRTSPYSQGKGHVKATPPSHYTSPLRAAPHHPHPETPYQVESLMRSPLHADRAEKRDQYTILYQQQQELELEVHSDGSGEESSRPRPHPGTGRPKGRPTQGRTKGRPYKTGRENETQIDRDIRAELYGPLHSAVPANSGYSKMVPPLPPVPSTPTSQVLDRAQTARPEHSIHPIERLHRSPRVNGVGAAAKGKYSNLYAEQMEMEGRTTPKARGMFRRQTPESARPQSS